MTPKQKRAEMSPEALAHVRKQDAESAKRRYLGDGGMISNAKVRERLDHLINERGVTARCIAERTGISETMIIAHHHGRRLGHDLTECRVLFERSILAARFTPDDVYLVPSIGTHRRIQALICAGYSYTFLAERAGYKLAVFHRKLVSDARDKIRRTFALEVNALYDDLLGRDPRVEGVTHHGYLYSQALAAKRGFVPGVCWDDDTIDNPEAMPEWTGECGTEEGYRLHLKYDVAVRNWVNGPDGAHGGRIRRRVLCAPCRAAHAESVQRYRKWGPVEIAAMLDKIDAGSTVRQVAESFGCSTRTVERFKRERREEDRHADDVR